MIKTKWVDEKHRIGLVQWNEAWLLTSPYPLKLVTEVYRGSLTELIVLTYLLFLLALIDTRRVHSVTLLRIRSIKLIAHP
jgi:hypothetical protein